MEGYRGYYLQVRQLSDRGRDHLRLPKGRQHRESHEADRRGVGEDGWGAEGIEGQAQQGIGKGRKTMGREGYGEVSPRYGSDDDSLYRVYGFSQSF